MNSRYLRTFLIASAAIVLILSLSVVFGCSGEDSILGTDVEQDQGELQAETGDKNVPIPPAIPIRPVPVPVDLTIVSYWTDIPGNTTSCGSSLPDITCSGPNGFLATVRVKNNGPGTVPRNSIRMGWFDSQTGWTSTYPLHPPIPAGGTFPIVKGYYIGPCGNPGAFYIRNFQAWVNFAGAIVETNYANNTSNMYPTCCDR